MRSVATLLLLTLTALVGPVEASVSPETGWSVPIETHVPSENAEDREVEEVHVTRRGDRSPEQHDTSVAGFELALSTALAPPPTPPPR